MQLITALAFATAAIAAPTAESACLKAASDLTFQIKDFTFDSKALYSTPSHLATSQASVSFLLANSAKPKMPLSCSATATSSYPTYFDGTQWYECDNTDTFTASFKYDLESGLVKVKAHWNCPDATFDASGSHVVVEEEDCDTETKKNKNWTLQNPGPYYRKITTECYDKITTFKPSKISAVA